MRETAGRRRPGGGAALAALIVGLAGCSGMPSIENPFARGDAAPAEAAAVPNLAPDDRGGRRLRHLSGGGRAPRSTPCRRWRRGSGSPPTRSPAATRWGPLPAAGGRGAAPARRRRAPVRGPRRRGDHHPAARVDPERAGAAIEGGAAASQENPFQGGRTPTTDRPGAAPGGAGRDRLLDRPALRGFGDGARLMEWPGAGSGACARTRSC